MQSRYPNLFHNRGMYNFEEEIFVRGEDCNAQNKNNNNNNNKNKDICRTTYASPTPQVPITQFSL